MAKSFTIISQQTAEMATIATATLGVVGAITAGAPTRGVDATAANPWFGSVTVMTDGQGTTSQRFTGIAKGNSNETVSATGTVELYEPFPGIVYNGFTKASTSADTAAEIIALRGKRVVFDLTTGDWTVDAAAADAQVNCVTLLGTGNPTLATLNFVYKPSGTYLDYAVSA